MSPIDGDRLHSLLAPERLIGREIHLLSETDSTNERAHEKANGVNQEGLVILAEHQTSGRGQRGSLWSAPPNSSLLFSILLFPEGSLAAPGFLTAWAASAVCELLRSHGLDARIKWPNDVLITRRKICGILVERRHATVVGIGLNVDIAPDQFPSELRLPATSLVTELGHSLNRTELFADLLRRLDESYRRALDLGPDFIHERWPHLAEDLLGQNVMVTTSTGNVTGNLISLRPDEGAVLLGSSGFPIHLPPETILRVEFCNPKEVSRS